MAICMTLISSALVIFQCQPFSSHGGKLLGFGGLESWVDHSRLKIAEKLMVNDKFPDKNENLGGVPGVPHFQTHPSPIFAWLYR